MLIVNQINDTYQVKGKHIVQYIKEAQRSALDGGIKRSNPIEYLTKPTINDTPIETMTVGTDANWMTPIYKYIADGILPTNIDAARLLQL